MMRFRKLRIAWSVFWGLAAVLLIVLWVRSYWWRINIQLPPVASRAFQVTLLTGNMSVGYYSLLTKRDRDDWLAIFENYHWSNPRFKIWEMESSWRLTFGDSNRRDVCVRFPYWLAILFLTCASVVSWMPQRIRFSLRTLLIATTLVAVVLGLIVWWSAKPPAAPPLDHVDVPAF
jgi:hypothetical protein